MKVGSTAFTGAHERVLLEATWEAAGPVPDRASVLFIVFSG